METGLVSESSRHVWAYGAGWNRKKMGEERLRPNEVVLEQRVDEEANRRARVALNDVVFRLLIKWKNELTAVGFEPTPFRTRA